MHTCDICHATVSELRRGRCWGCYARWVETRPVPHNARCVTCHERRRRMLRSMELFSAWHPICFSCAGLVGQLAEMPGTIAGVRTAITRERRRTDRRAGRVDGRVFRYERRVGQRRDIRTDELGLIDDDMIIEITVDEGEIDFDDMTCIRELVSPDALAG